MKAASVFVLGASAGGLEALKRLVAALPADLNAAVLVVLHVASNYKNNLPEFLSAAGLLPASIALDQERIQPGHIYVAPSDCHLLVEDGRLALSRSARENYSRPAIDPLFRTAAQAYGPRVTGVVLSGTLGDGTVGLMAVKAHGGTTVVQDPRELTFSEMPRQAIANAPIDYILSIDEIAALLIRKAAESPPAKKEAFRSLKNAIETSPILVKNDLQAQVEGQRSNQISAYTCPECGGSLWQVDEGGTAQQFRCHVGHAYFPDVLLEGMSNHLENAMWGAVRALVERANLRRQLAKRHRDAGNEIQAKAMEEQATLDDAHIRLIRENILEFTRPGPEPEALVSVGR